jgi:hypothetical protein
MAEAETIATPWSLTRQRRYDEIARELCGGVDPDPYSRSGPALHDRIMERLDAECAALTDC